MHKIDTPGADAANEFTSGNPFAQIPATIVGFQWLNTVQRELVKVIEDEGLVLDKQDDTQLAAALLLHWRTRLDAEMGRTMNFPTAPYTGVAGDGVLVQDTFGIATAAFTVALAVSVAFYAKDQSLPKETPLVIVHGSSIYWNDGAREVTTTAAGNHHIGLAAASASSGATTVPVQLFPPGRPAD